MREDNVRCFNCEKLINEIIDGVITPSYVECYNNGAIPVPNAGWLCSQECALDFELKHQIKLERNSDGLVDYYDGHLE